MAAQCLLQVSRGSVVNNSSLCIIQLITKPHQLQARDHNIPRQCSHRVASCATQSPWSLPEEALEGEKEESLEIQKEDSFAFPVGQAGLQ